MPAQSMSSFAPWSRMRTEGSLTDLGCPVRPSLTRAVDRHDLEHGAGLVNSQAVPTHILHRPARVVITAAAHIGGRPAVPSSGLSGVKQPPMIVRMTTTSRPQRRYDDRLRTSFSEPGPDHCYGLGVPRSTARGWLDAAPRVMVGLEVADFTEPELRQEILKLRRRVKKLTALLRLTLALLRSLKFTLTHERVPDGRDKIRILRAVDGARAFVPLRTLLRFLRLSRVASMPGGGCSTRVRLTIGRPARTRRPIV